MKMTYPDGSPVFAGDSLDDNPQGGWPRPAGPYRTGVEVSSGITTMVQEHATFRAALAAHAGESVEEALVP